MQRPKRVNVVGVSGSGKSTVARRLAEKLGCPHVELDVLYWGPAWQPRPDDVFFASVEKAVAGPAWVLDGNYDRTAPIKWKNVELVVWVDYSFVRTLAQSIRRALTRIVTRKEIWPGTGNRESFRLTFLSRDSILLWMLTSFGRIRRRYEERLSDPR
jgi:adenylate kinase family enzyme